MSGSDKRRIPRWRAPLMGLLSAAFLAGIAARAADAPPKLTEAADALAELQRQAALQKIALRECGAFHGFRFEDVVARSGIRFEHHVVDDAGKYYKPVHYDHGNGLAVADVDGDGLPDLYFTTQLGTNQLWRNLGGAKFEDITDKAGVGLPDQISVTASFADINNDGRPDLFVTTVRHGNHLYLNRGDGRFEDITQTAGLQYSGHSSGAVFLDFDRDGRLDLFLCNVGTYTSARQGRGGYWIGLRDGFSGHQFPDRAEASLLYRNIDGTTFRDVSQEMGLVDTSWSGDATFTDLNADGFPDLYVFNMQGDDHFYVNEGGKKFSDRTAAYFPKTPWGAMGGKFFDFNQDGRLDLFVTDMHSDMTEIATRSSKTNLTRAFEARKADPWCTTQYTDAYLQNSSNNIFGNAFYLNRGEDRFEEVSDTVGAETFWPWGVSVADFNADGFEDAFVTAGMGFGFRYAINSLLLNDQGRRFHAAEFATGLEPRAGGRIQKTAFVLACSGADRTHPFCAGRTGDVPILEALSSRSSAAVDLDGDGDLDLVTLEMNDRPQILLNTLSTRAETRFLKVRLIGKTSNRDGLGAIVQVTRSDDRTLTQIHDGKLGYYAQSSAPLYFGLGSEGRARSLVVQWPSGKRQTVAENLPDRGLITVTEDSP